MNMGGEQLNPDSSKCEGTNEIVRVIGVSSNGVFMEKVNPGGANEFDWFTLVSSYPSSNVATQLAYVYVYTVEPL